MNRTASDSAPMTDAGVAFRSSRMAIEPDWIDYNGHLNMAYYNVLFDRGVDQALLSAGLGPDYVSRNNASFFGVEAHVCYLRELSPEDGVYVTFRLVDHDDKKLHAFLELLHADEGWLSATSEQLFLHVDMTSKRTTAWPAEVRDKLDAMGRAHAHLPPALQIGRSIAMRRKGG